jgi:hypothetical protein
MLSLHCSKTSLQVPAIVAWVCLTYAGQKWTLFFPEEVHRIRTTVAVGPVSYAVKGVKWSRTLDEYFDANRPKHHYLIVELSVTNNTNDERTIPFLTLEDRAGEYHQECHALAGSIDWRVMGRILPPHNIADGPVVFDVPPSKGPFRLRVYGGDLETESTALFEIPAERPSPPSMPSVLGKNF